MNLTPSQRAQVAVRHLVRTTGYRQSEIGEMLGYTNKSSFSSLLNGHRPLPPKFAEKINEIFPEINPAFIRGESDELVLKVEKNNDKQPESASGSGVYLPLELVKMFTDLSATVRSQQETIRLLVGEKTQAAM